MAATLRRVAIDTNRGRPLVGERVGELPELVGARLRGEFLAAPHDGESQALASPGGGDAQLHVPHEILALDARARAKAVSVEEDVARDGPRIDARPRVPAARVGLGAVSVARRAERDVCPSEIAGA